MPRLRKMRRKQKYQYHVNRKQLNQKLNRLPRINCDAVRNAWDFKKSMSQNLTSMGLVADPNKIISTKFMRGEEMSNPATVDSIEVVQSLQEEAKEAYVNKKAVAHLLPSEMVKKLCTFLDKHGEDYETMARDPTNFYQETAAQLRTQVKRLKKVPQQWIPYLKTRGLLSTNHKMQDE